MIVFGDFYQLAPVRGRFLFTDSVFWSMFCEFQLQINQRQIGDNEFINTLNNIRIGHLTPKDVALLTSRLKSKFEQVDFTNIIHLYPTLAEVRRHNDAMQNLQQDFLRYKSNLQE